MDESGFPLWPAGVPRPTKGSEGLEEFTQQEEFTPRPPSPQPPELDDDEENEESEEFEVAVVEGSAAVQAGEAVAVGAASSSAVADSSTAIAEPSGNAFVSTTVLPKSCAGLPSSSLKRSEQAAQNWSSYASKHPTPAHQAINSSFVDILRC